MIRLIDKQVDDTWLRFPIEELSAGDTFRMYEPDGTTLVVGMWTVLENHACQDGQPGLVAEEVELQ